MPQRGDNSCIWQIHTTKLPPDLRAFLPSRHPSPGIPTILLVEDEAFVRDVAYQALCSAGYRVLAARSAADAVRAFRYQAEGVQLLLTDVVLPDKSGCDLALELVNGGGCLKAIFISAPGRRVAIPLASGPVRGRRFLPRAAADHAR